MRREETFIDQKTLSVSDLQIDYLNLDNLVRNIERANFSLIRITNVTVRNQIRASDVH